MTRDPTMNLADLRLFVQVADAGSLSRTAQVLETTQPAVSRRIAAIERAWGGRLFHRTGRGVTLTDLGERTLPRAQELLENADRLAEEISGDAGALRGTVRLGSLPSVALAVVPSLLRHFRESGVDVRLEVLEGSNGQIEEWLAEGKVDLSIVYRYGQLPRGEIALTTVDSYLVGKAGDPLLAVPAIPFAKVDGLPLVLPPRPNMTRHVLDQIARRVGIRLNVALEVSSMLLHNRIPQIEGYYTIAPYFGVMDEVKSGRLQAVPLVEPSLPRTVAAGYSTKRPLSSAAREVLRLIRLFVRTELPSVV
jgi:DNA-binding transcriptional LysR family regulator